MDLDSLGTFFGQLGTGFASAYGAVNRPQPVQYQRASNIPQGAAVQTYSAGGSSWLVLLVVGLGIGLLVRSLRPAAA